MHDPKHEPGTATRVAAVHHRPELLRVPAQSVAERDHAAARSPRVLVAGVGNPFCRDHGFGPEVVRRLVASDALDPDVRAVDYGNRGLQLADDLRAGCDVLVLVDAAPVGERPGDLAVLDVGEGSLGLSDLVRHRMAPVTVLASLHGLGDRLPPTYLLGCRPAETGQGVGLSAPVQRAVPEAVSMVSALLRHPCLGALRSRAEVLRPGRMSG